MTLPIVHYADGRTKPVKNLGYLLRRWRDVTCVEVTPFNQTELTHTPGFTAFPPDCTLIVYFNNKDKYVTDFHSAGILWIWLSRPVLVGAPLTWFGLETKCGSKAPDVLAFLKQKGHICD